MKRTTKIKLSSSEEKLTVGRVGMSANDTPTGCVASGFCPGPDKEFIHCTSNIHSGCTVTETSVTCIKKDGESGVAIPITYECTDPTPVGSGSGANDPVKACEGLNDGAECSWHNGTNVQRGKCMTIGDRTYCVSGAKKKL